MFQRSVEIYHATLVPNTLTASGDGLNYAIIFLVLLPKATLDGKAPFTKRSHGITTCHSERKNPQNLQKLSKAGAPN